MRSVSEVCGSKMLSASDFWKFILKSASRLGNEVCGEEKKNKRSSA